MGKQIGGLAAFFSQYHREKLMEIMKRDEIDNSKDAILYCIMKVWMDEIGQYKDESVVGR